MSFRTWSKLCFGTAVSRAASKEHTKIYKATTWEDVGLWQVTIKGICRGLRSLPDKISRWPSIVLWTLSKEKSTLESKHKVTKPIHLQESFSNSFEMNKPSDFAKHLKDQICGPSTRFLQEQRDTVVIVHSPQKNNSCVEKLHILNLCCPAKRCGFESLYQTGFAPYPQTKSSASSSVDATLTTYLVYSLHSHQRNNRLQSIRPHLSWYWSQHMWVEAQGDGIRIWKVDETCNKNFAGEVVNPFKFHHLHQNVGGNKHLGFEEVTGHEEKINMLPVLPSCTVIWHSILNLRRISKMRFSWVPEELTGLKIATMFMVSIFCRLFMNSD